MLDRSCKPWKPVSSFESQMISEVLLNLRMGWSCYIKTFDSRKKKKQKPLIQSTHRLMRLFLCYVENKTVAASLYIFWSDDQCV